jgi:AcrR family transcriptional regulator
MKNSERSIKKPKGRTSDLAARAIAAPPGEEESSTARILAAAEEEFASAGFDATSIRQVARKAGVPMALIGYHFGGKSGLYRAIFEARTPALVEQRRAGLALADLETDPERKLDLIVKSLLVPLLRLRTAEHGSQLGRLLAREVSDPSSVERGIVKDMLDPIAEAVTTRLAEVLPGRSKAEIHWVYHVMIGAMIHALGDAGRIRRLSGGAADPQDVEATTQTMLDILLNGIRPRRGNHQADNGLAAPDDRATRRPSVGSAGRAQNGAGHARNRRRARSI